MKIRVLLAGEGLEERIISPNVRVKTSNGVSKWAKEDEKRYKMSLKSIFYEMIDTDWRALLLTSMASAGWISQGSKVKILSYIFCRNVITSEMAAKENWTLQNWT